MIVKKNEEWACGSESENYQILPTSEKYEDEITEKTNTAHSVRIVYVTDPICSACWVFEPQIRRLQLEYGHSIETAYKMGGLLRKWEGFNAVKDVSGPSDVAKRWNDMGHYFQTPIDGDLWLTDPLDSSDSPSIAFKAAQIQDQQKSLIFLRKLRENALLKEVNISKRENILRIAESAGLDIDRFVNDYDGGEAVKLFNSDMEKNKRYGVRAFPTLIFFDEDGFPSCGIVGIRNYNLIAEKIKKIYPKIKKQGYSKKAEDLFQVFDSMTAREYSILAGITIAEAAKQLNKMEQDHQIKSIEVKGKKLWYVR